jgi:hypothetical protein
MNDAVAVILLVEDDASTCRPWIAREVSHQKSLT